LQGTKATISNKIKQRIRSRGAIQSVIGHMQSDHRMGRRFLSGFQGDQINALLAGCAFNLKKILRAVFFVGFLGGIIVKKIVTRSKSLKNRHFRAIFFGQNFAMIF
jgi:hypothetical protein